MYCHYCGEPCIREITVIREINTCREGIEMDVEVERNYCSEECREEDED